MKHLPRLALVCAFFALPLLRAEPAAPAGQTASAPYPLTTCVVSGDKLGSEEMGPPVDFVYTEAGKPDRLVRFCCKGCIRDFKKDPAKYLKQIDEAAAKTPASPSDSAAPAGTAR